jgi:teichuronic acid biosynthesis glycosyltransferase TuaG
MNELISIVMPVYNASAWLEETVESVQKQTYENWELIAVDDRSPDESFRMLERMAQKDARIRPIRREENGGAARTRNTGMDAARGQYLAFLDSDDLWDAKKLEKELAFLKERQAAFAFTAYEFGDENGRGNGRIVHVPPTLDYRHALSRTIIFTTTVMFDLQRIDRELIRMPDVKSEDTATWWKILRSGYTAHGLNENLAIYRRPKGSLSSNKMEAVRRIWNLYRNQEKLSVPVSAWHLFFWAWRAAARRI